MKKIKRYGFSLLEIAMVLAIGAIIMAGVMMYYNTASVGEKTEELVDEIMLIQDAVHSYGAGKSDYSWMGSDGSLVVSRSGMIPAKWLVGSISGGNFNSALGILNPFGGSLKIAPGGQGGGSDNSYYIAVWNVPTQACTKLATMNWGTGVIDINVNEQYFVQNSGLSPKQANTACASGQSQFLAWDFW